jgi:hypothetical protein
MTTGDSAERRSRFGSVSDWAWWALTNMGRFSLLLIAVAFAQNLMRVIWNQLPAGEIFLATLLEPILLSFVLLSGALVYLIIVAFIPSAWPRLAQRLLAVAVSPIVGTFILLSLIPSGDVWDRNWVAFEFVFPVLCGLIVRLPDHKAKRIAAP